MDKQTRTSRTAAYRKLMRPILSLESAPGQLVNDAALAVELGMSPTPGSRSPL